MSLQVGRAALALFRLLFQHGGQKEEGPTQRLPNTRTTPPADPAARV